MAVFRVHKTNDYTVMANHHLRNMGLSLSAKGLLSVILSLPPDWNYSIHGLASINKEGDKAIKSALDELREHGYVVVTRINPTPGNNRVTYRYDIYETPHQLGESEEPQVSQAYPSEGVQVEGVQAEALLTGGQLNTKELSKEYQSTKEYIPPQKKTRRSKPFVPPTLEEVEAYVREKGYSFSARAFVDYYSASNWHFANGKPVKSWKQCCVTWNSNHRYDRPQRKPVDASQYRAEAWGNVEYRGA